MNVAISVNNVLLNGILAIPKQPRGLVIFSHGSGSSRFSPRNKFVATELQKAGFATLLVDLLTNEEDEIYQNRFNIDLLTTRLVAITKWIKTQEKTRNLPIGYFGASTGAASAINAASLIPSVVSAVVSRGGRPDLAAQALEKVEAPTLFIVGGKDFGVIELNKEAYKKLGCEKKLHIVKGATHLFEEEGALEEVAILARDWFVKYLPFGRQDRQGRPKKSQ